ncbi:MAG: AAA family ATPase [Candidatus Tectomicrobia bacterium]|uniref:AAA family ATPase n=1 Tax=Tectimicrobiota bacterium TaxID=2528274 RepID=A0A932GPH1_UNCTE|nr:AAA family ATPase [Candidatus Tectomicrobia bacterium]
MGIMLQVESCPEQHSARGLALLDPQVMKKHGIRAKQIIEINNQFRKRVLARVGPPLAQDRGLGIIRIDQYLRQSIKALIGDQVEVEPAEVSPVDRIVLAPFLDLSQVENLARFLAETFAARGLMATPGAILYATVPGAHSGSAFKVLDLSPGAGLITPKTTVELKYIFNVWPGMAAEVTFEDVGGMSSQIRQVRELVEIPLRFPDVFRRLGISPPRGIIFYGPPGAGKTHLARAIANELEARFLYINGPDVVSSTYGETEANLRKIFHEASHHLPSIIFIDELDIIAPKRGESGTQADTRMATQFLELMDGLKKVEGVLVVGTTNRVDLELCREAGLNAMRRQLGSQWNGDSKLSVSLDRLIVEPQDLQTSLSRMRPSALRETMATVPEVRWEDIGGLDEVKRQLREIVEKPMLHPEVFRDMKLKPPVGILLYGPPGSGKTLLAQALASEAQANFLAVKGTEIFSKWLGESEEGIRHIFRVARQVSPAVIFFDQIDALAPVRSASSGSRASERVVNQILAELDGIEPLSSITVVAATNRTDLLDPAILRPGRFGIHIHVPLPDAREREEILQIYLRGVPLSEGSSAQEIIRSVAGHTSGFCGAELQAICQEAKLAALRQVEFAHALPLDLAHFEAALQRVQASRRFYEGSRQESS